MTYVEHKLFGRLRDADVEVLSILEVVIVDQEDLLAGIVLAGQTRNEG